MTCPRCTQPIPPILLACPICFGAIEVPTEPPSPVEAAVRMATTPRLITKPPVMDVEVTRRDSGFLSARMIAGEERGRNITANHAFTTVKRAQAFVLAHLSERFGCEVVVRWVL